MDVRVGLWRKLSAEELMLLNCGVGENSWESLIQPVHPKGDQYSVFMGRTDAKAETPILWPPHVKNWLIGKDCDAGRDWGQEEKGTTEDEMVGWHHRLDAHEFGWTPGVGDGQGGLVCWDSWGHKSDMTGRLNWTEKDTTYLLYPTGQNPKEVMFLPQMPTVRKPILDQSSNKLIIHKNHQDLWFKCKLWFIGFLADTGTAFQTSS